MGFLHHLDEVVGAVGDDVIIYGKSHITFALAIGFSKGIPSERVREYMAEGKQIVKVGSALKGGHGGFDEVDSLAFDELGGFLGTADVLSGRGIVGH